MTNSATIPLNYCSSRTESRCRYFLGASLSAHVLFFFFFQAEDGIRDVAVTGVQTCALPIYTRVPQGFCAAPATADGRAPPRRLARRRGRPRDVCAPHRRRS